MIQPDQTAPSSDADFALPADCVVAWCDYEERRSRLSTFFRLILAIPHLIWAALWSLAAGFAVIGAWFAVVFTARYPEGLYNFVVRFHRYYARVLGYVFLLDDHFPSFGGDPGEPSVTHFVIGPPKERYNRAVTFFRLILAIPFAVVYYFLNWGLQLATMMAWFVIVVLGRQLQNLHELMNYCFGYVIRYFSWMALLTEDWPKFTDEAIGRALQQRGHVGPLPPDKPLPAIGTPVIPPAAAQPPPPPPPPAVG